MMRKSTKVRDILKECKDSSILICPTCGCRTYSITVDNKCLNCTECSETKEESIKEDQLFNLYFRTKKYGLIFLSLSIIPFLIRLYIQQKEVVEAVVKARRSTPGFSMQNMQTAQEVYNQLEVNLGICDTFMIIFLITGFVFLVRAQAIKVHNKLNIIQR
jgi:uncharacterized membrane protein